MTSTAESNSMEDSKGDLHSEETKPTTSVPSNSSEPAEEDKSSRTSTDKPSHHHAHSPSHTHSRDSSAHSPPPIVKETLDACITVSPTGVLQVKQYELRRIIGQGAFGIVNLGVDVNTGIKYVSLFVYCLLFLVSSEPEMSTRSTGAAHNHVSDTVIGFILLYLCCDGSRLSRSLVKQSFEKRTVRISSGSDTVAEDPADVDPPFQPRRRSRPWI